jgi:hypothetical protein
MEYAQKLTAQFSPAGELSFESGNAATTYSVEDTNAWLIRGTQRA